VAVLIFNPNPVFDRTITVREMIPGAVMRTLDVELTAGGKGINVARALRSFGDRAPVLIPVGAEDRDQYAGLLTREGADARIIEVDGPVRIASIYLEQVSTQVTVVNDEGHPMSNADWNRVHNGLLANVRAGDIVLVMGSFPPGLNPRNLTSLIEALHVAGAKVLIDVNPHWLAASLSAHPDVVTPNLDEAETALSETSAHVMDANAHDEGAARERAMKAALSLCERGARRAFVTAGPTGVAIAHAGEVSWLPAHRVEVVSTVGAGDSFVAGLAHVWASTEPADDVDWATAVRFGIAAAANSCENVRAGGIDPVRVEEIMESLREGSAS
jgi:1-phosphofructokinase family hexose kinase